MVDAARCTREAPKPGSGVSQPSDRKGMGRKWQQTQQEEVLKAAQPGGGSRKRGAEVSME